MRILSLIILISIIISNNKYLALPGLKTKINLNNTGTETIRIISPDGSVISEVTYENAPQGLSLSAFDAFWDWTGHPTPNEPNSLSQDDFDTGEMEETAGDRDS